MKSLGLDLSLVHTGVALLEDGKQILRTGIKTKPSKLKRPIDEIKRMQDIVDQVMEIVTDNRPDVVVIEGIAFMSRNSTALAQLAALNYMIRAQLMMKGIGFLIVAPTSLKKFITNKGNAQKDEVMLAIFKRYGVTITDNNEADAYGLAQLGLAIKDGERKITGIQKEVISLISSQHGE